MQYGRLGVVTSNRADPHSGDNKRTGAVIPRLEKPRNGVNMNEQVL
jgi:hypothetical protein